LPKDLLMPTIKWFARWQDIQVTKGLTCKSARVVLS
jgi:hypothetical protein